MSSGSKVWGGVRDLLRRWSPVAIYPSTLIVIALQAAGVTAAHLTDREILSCSVRTGVLLCLSLLPSLCLFHLLHLGLGRRRAALVVAELCLLCLYALLVLEHFSLRAAPEFGMIAPAPVAFVHREMRWISSSPACCIGVLAIVAGLLLLLALELLWRTLSRWRPPASRRRMGTAAALYACLLLVPGHNHDEVASFLRSLVRHFGESSPSLLAAAGLHAEQPYPYLQPEEPSRLAADPPHIFIVAMESFNAGFVEAMTDDGRPVTPTLNRLLREGLYVEHFYANSVQTARGHLAILCSILPGMWRKVLVAYPELRLHCLPRLLAEHGYRSVFFSGQNDLDYDDTDAAMHRLGFTEVRTVGEKGVACGEKKDNQCWGWGWQDDRVYRELFALLERETPAHQSPPPTFAFVATVSHHYTFDQAPARERRLYAKPGNFREHFMNSLNMADRYLDELSVQLRNHPRFRNAIVVLVGDHGFPTDERGDPANEFHAVEENFRVPLLVLWPGHVPAVRRTEGTHSQLDIAPTLLELIGLRSDHHFQGRSLLEPTEPSHAALLVQPFDGLYLGAVRWPYKYLRRRRTGEEWLFDLSRDANERRDLSKEKAYRAAKESLRRQLAIILFNQRLLDSNRIWPAGPCPASRQESRVGTACRRAGTGPGLSR